MLDKKSRFPLNRAASSHRPALGRSSKRKLAATERRITHISWKYFGISLEDAESQTPLTVPPFNLLLAQHFSLSQCHQSGPVRSRTHNLLVIGVSSSPRASSSSSSRLTPLISLGVPLLFIPIARRRAAHKGRSVSRGVFKIEIFTVENGKSLTDKARRHGLMRNGCRRQLGELYRMIRNSNNLAP